MDDHEIPVILWSTWASCSPVSIIYYWPQPDDFYDSRIPWIEVELGVPQNLVLRPLLYILFAIDILSLFTKHLAIAMITSKPMTFKLFCMVLPVNILLLLEFLTLSPLILVSRCHIIVCLNSDLVRYKQQLLKLYLPLLSAKFPSFATSEVPEAKLLALGGKVKPL